MKKQVRVYRYIAALVVGAALFVVCAYAGELLGQESPEQVFGKLSDCFAVSGAVIAGIGALSWANSKGAYDILSYGVDSLIKPFTSRRSEYESFYEFKLRKAEDRRPWQKEWLFVGLGFLLLSFICLAIYFIL